MIRRPPRSTRTYTLLPYPTRVRLPRPSEIEREKVRSRESEVEVDNDLEFNSSISQCNGHDRIREQTEMLRTSRSSTCAACQCGSGTEPRSEEHTSELQSLMRISYAVFCLIQKTQKKHEQSTN